MTLTLDTEQQAAFSRLPAKVSAKLLEHRQNSELISLSDLGLRGGLTKHMSNLCVVLTAFPNMNVLYLNNNNLNELPPEIGRLKNLRGLVLNDNALETLPSEIGELKNLDGLYIINNKLKTLPSEIGELKNLHTLYLSQNNLITLPPEIGELNKLQLLTLNENYSLTKLPLEIGEMKALQPLYLGDTGLSKQARLLINASMAAVESKFSDIAFNPEDFTKPNPDESAYIFTFRNCTFENVDFSALQQNPGLVLKFENCGFVNIPSFLTLNKASMGYALAFGGNYLGHTKNPNATELVAYRNDKDPSKCIVTLAQNGPDIPLPLNAQQKGGVGGDWKSKMTQQKINPYFYLG